MTTTGKKGGMNTKSGKDLMPTKDSDPLAWIQEKGWLCLSCEGAIDWKDSPCYCKRNDKRTRLLPEPAVRKIMVEAARRQAVEEEKVGDKFSGAESLNLFADRLEGGGRDG